jgi:hypothetical protein
VFGVGACVGSVGAFVGAAVGRGVGALLAIGQGLLESLLDVPYEHWTVVQLEQLMESLSWSLRWTFC